MILANKRGSRYLSIWWIFCLVIVASSVVVAVLAFYVAEIDARDFEVSLLEQRATQCLSMDGFLTNDFFKDDFNFNNYCGLETTAFNGKEIPFYLRVSLFDEKNVEVKKVIYGTASYEQDCLVAKKATAKYYPKCGQKEVPVYYFSNSYKGGKLQIFAASNNVPRKV